MESDFTTRNHLDSVVPFSDPSMGELLQRYLHPPVDPKIPENRVEAASGSSTGVSASNAYISNLIGQLQGQLQGAVQSIMGNKEPQSLAGSGLQLSINADILRWMIVLAFAIVLVVVLFQFMNRRKKNPLKKRLRRLEAELQALQTRKNPIRAIEYHDYEEQEDQEPEDPDADEID